MRELESAENFKTRCHETKRRVYGGESLLCQGIFFFALTPSVPYVHVLLPASMGRHVEVSCFRRYVIS